MPRELYDSGDLDAIRDLATHRGYLIVVERINDQLERTRRSLETLPIESVPKAQGEVSALRTALRIPEILASEIALFLPE